MSTALKKYTQQELPAQLTLNLEPLNESNPGITLLGGVITVIGFLILIFGPNKVYYNPYEGLSFLQYFLVYPGIVIAIGVLIMRGGRSSSNLTAEALNQREISLKMEASKQLDFDPQTLPKDESLYVNHLGGRLYEVGINRQSSLS